MCRWVVVTFMASGSSPDINDKEENMTKKETERNLRLLAQGIRHEVKDSKIQEHMLDLVREILISMEKKE